MNPRPNHFEPGKRTPAERSGEAHPMTPSGGIAAIRTQSGTRTAALPLWRVKNKPQDTASNAAAVRQRTTPISGVPWAPKKARAPGITGQLAAA